jgi:hypothetical protein
MISTSCFATVSIQSFLNSKSTWHKAFFFPNFYLHSLWLFILHYWVCFFLFFFDKAFLVARIPPLTFLPRIRTFPPNKSLGSLLFLSLKTQKLKGKYKAVDKHHIKLSPTGKTGGLCGPLSSVLSGSQGQVPRHPDWGEGCGNLEIKVLCS